MTIVHRLTVLPYEDRTGHTVVVACDCGWGDTCTAELGRSWDAVVAYAFHLQEFDRGEAEYARFSGDPAERIPKGSPLDSDRAEADLSQDGHNLRDTGSTREVQSDG